MSTRFAFGLLIAASVSLTSVAGPPRGEFPGYGLVPKEDTGATRFLAHHPEYDGRGVVIAIFDTGVDPGAPGMQVTTDGQPKIVDLVDASGSGDVDTSKVVAATGGTLDGLSGRTLSINPAWSNPTGEYHLGLKPAFEIYPGGLVARLKAERKEDWLIAQRAAVVRLEQQLERFDREHPDPKGADQKRRADLEARLEALKELQEHYDDPGPIFDCVVFHDGDHWRAAIDTDEDGDLADEKAMTNYRVAQEWSTFGDEDLLNFAVNIYANGNLLSIVADCGSHGTHVAGIVAAHFPDKPELNGIAPGAQLVGVKIGDTRLGSTAIGTGATRGCISVLQNNCDLINMSFGGPTADPDHGRTIELYSEIVNKHNVIFCASAGNEGPCLSTAGAPGATTSALFGIAAYISPEMQDVQYSLRDQTPPRNYTFTSRGPTYDGDLGPKFAAPGGAIAPVPNWVLSGKQQMHGTSMASPNACGSIALLLSGLRAEGKDWTPHRIRRALENTATTVPDVSTLALGRGLIRIDRAWDYLREYEPYTDQDLRFDIRVSTRDDARGIYLREPWELTRPLDARVMVTPVFHEDADNRGKVDFDMRFNLEATARWIECADHLLVTHAGRRLDIRVDPTDLEPGLYYEEVRGYDASSPDRGPVWRLPVTVVVPEELDAGEPTWRAEIPFGPGYEERHFMVVPTGATWADLRLKRTDDDGDLAVIVTHLVQLVPGYGFHEHETKRYLRLGAGEEEVLSLPVVGGRTLELCLAEYTGYLCEGDVEVELEFHGIVPDREELCINGSEIATRFDVRAPLRSERVRPSATLDTLRRPLRPVKHELRPLDNLRDQLPDERHIYELILTYEFEMDEVGEVTPNVAIMSFLDEKTWQSRMFMIFDEAKQWLHTGWLYPDSVKLDKGKYTLRFHLRLADPAALEKLTDMVLMLDYDVSGTRLGFFADEDDVTLDGRSFGTQTLPAGEQAMIYVATPAADDLPDMAQPGDILLGTLTLGAADSSEFGAGNVPGGYPVRYVVPPKPVAKKPGKSGHAKDADEEKTAGQKLNEALRDFKVEQLATLHGEEDRALFDRLARDVLADYPNHIPVLLEQLRRADGEQREENLDAVVAAADAVIEQIDTTALAAHFGLKLDPEDDAAARERAEMQEKKDALVEALHRKARALFDMARHGNGRPETDSDAAIDKAFEETFARLQKWVDTTDKKYLELHIDREIRHGRLGQALELLNNRIADASPDKELYEQRIELLDKLGWSHWKQYEEQWQLKRFPGDYPPF